VGVGSRWLALASIAVLSGACTDDSCRLSGTLTYLGTSSLNLAGQPLQFSLDDDANENNTPVVSFTGTWTSGTTHRYSFDVMGFAPQSYYLYAKVTPPGALVYGWYNEDPVQPFNPRLLVPVQCGSVYDFDVDAT
jgi:hypothetical protein